MEDGDTFGITFDPDPIPPHLRQFLLERDMATALNLVREITLQGVDFAPSTWPASPMSVPRSFRKNVVCCPPSPPAAIASW